MSDNIENSKQKKVNKAKENLLKTPVILLMAVISGIAAVMNYAFRISYVFIDSAVFNGLSMTLLWISIINTLLLLSAYVLKAYKITCKGKLLSDTKGFAVAYFVCFGVTIFFVIYIIVNMIISGAESIPVAFKLLRENILYVIGVFTIVLLLAILPNVKNKKVIASISIVVGLGIFFSAIFTIYPDRVYKLTADPMVVDSGENFSIIFATSDIGTGYVEYEYEGEKYKVYDEKGGRLKGDSKIHTVKVPKEHLIDNTYKVGSKRVIDELSYGGRTGKEVVSKGYEFTVPKGDKQSYLTVSDWHTHLNDAYNAVDNVGEYDGVILLGDAAPGLMFEDEIKDYIVEFGGKLSKGTKPVIYVRGNHETRGKKASELLDYLGMDSFYYTAGYGDYEFVVLDSGEDKEDSHPEYGGMNNYAQYRKDMVDWMKTLEKNDKKTIALVHSHVICLEKELEQAAYDELKRLGISQIVGGHIHTTEYMEYNGMKVYLDGGHKNNEYTASKITLSKEGYLLEAWNNKDKKVFDKKIAW